MQFFYTDSGPKVVNTVCHQRPMKIWKCYEWVTVLNGVIIRLKFHDWSNLSAILTEVTDIQHITMLHS